MVEYDRNQERESIASAPLKICVAGIGGAGLNVLDRITLDRIIDATLVSMHSDVRVLSHAMTPHKIQLGSELMRGIGSGGDPELGREAAITSREAIKAVFQGHDMVFLCAGLGGGTASGATPVVAEIAKECGALVFVFATMPFSFEGRRRLMQAEIALEEVQKNTDALILFENNRMGELTLPKEGIQKAFSQADQLIGHSVRAIATMVTRPGIIQLGLSDLIMALRSPNTRCLFGFGEGKGANRVTDALKRALKSPLVNQGQLLAQARNLLVHVAGGESLTLAEVEVLMKQLGKCVPDQTQILFGVSTAPNLGDTVAVTLISSLSANEMLAGNTLTSASPEPVAAPPVVQRAAPVPAAVPAPAPAPVAKAAPAPASAPAPVAEMPPPIPAPAPAPVHTPAPVVEVAVVVHQHELELPIVEPSNGHVAPVTPEPVVAKAPEPEPVVEAAPEPEPVASPVAPVVEQDSPPVESSVAPTVPDAPARPIKEIWISHPAVLSKPSIFALDEDTEDDEFENEVEEEIEAEAPEPPEEKIAPPPARIAPVKMPQARDPEIRPRATTKSTPVPTTEPVMAATAKAAVTPAQPSLNLHQEEVTRFKGTEKTIVEGEDLDVPTWMRMKQRVRQ